MIKLPDEICDSTFEGNLRRGCVIRTLLKCYDGKDRPHYFVTLTNSPNQSTQVFVVATSRIDFYEKNPFFNRDILRISANQLSFFPKDTIIDCRKIHVFDRSMLKERFRDNDLQFTGVLPDTYLTQLINIVNKSRLISKKDRLLILGDSKDNGVRPQY